MSLSVVVLAGGRGTRSADPSKAKLAQVINGASLMEWHLRLIQNTPVREVIVVAGHAGDQVEELCDSINHPLIKIKVLHEVEQHGTVNALRFAAENSDASEFLVILGDILMSLDLPTMLQEWEQSKKAVAVVVHPSTHPEDSDAVFTSFDGGVKVTPKKTSRIDIPNMSSAGLFAITRAGLERYSKCRDFGSDVLPAAGADGELFAFISSHYLKDTGTPERLQAAQADVISGAFNRRGSLAPRKAIFLDRDGVVNPALPEIYHPQDYALAPGVAEAIREANKSGIPVFIVTNQPGIAKGFMTESAHEGIRARMDALLGAQGAFIDDYAYCPHHPEGGFEGEVPELKIVCDCRKPAPGLALTLSHAHAIDLSGSVMVGDTQMDAGLAKATGMKFIHVTPHCDVEDPHQCETLAADAIWHGIEVVRC